MEMVPFAVGGFFAALVATHLFVGAMRWAGSGQPIREYGPKIHEHKRGTPTMGGAVLLIVLLGALLAYQLLERRLSVEGLLLITATLFFGLIGLLDDMLKYWQQHSRGLLGRYKLLLQLAVIALLLTLLGSSLEAPLKVPFAAFELNVDGPLLYALIALTLLGAVNAWNLTDGLDGLASGITLIALLAYGLLLFEAPGDLFGLNVLFGAVLLGFFPFNVHPARIFLGDTGSMALGGFVAMTSVLTGTELFLLFFGVVPLVETLSVMMQVASFRVFRRRIFKVSPLHHHFERAEGIDYTYLLPSVELPEWAITLIFWGLSVGFALLGLLAYYY